MLATALHQEEELVSFLLLCYFNLLLLLLLPPAVLIYLCSSVIKLDYYCLYCAGLVWAARGVRGCCLLRIANQDNNKEKEKKSSWWAFNSD